MPYARDDEMVTGWYLADAIQAGRVGDGAVAVLELTTRRAKPRLDVHVFHRLAAVVGDDAADRACAKQLDRRVSKPLTVFQRHPRRVALGPALPQGARLVAGRGHFDAELPHGQTRKLETARIIRRALFRAWIHAPRRL